MKYVQAFTLPVPKSVDESWPDYVTRVSSGLLDYIGNSEEMAIKALAHGGYCKIEFVALPEQEETETDGKVPRR